MAINPTNPIGINRFAKEAPSQNRDVETRKERPDVMQRLLDLQEASRTLDATSRGRSAAQFDYDKHGDHTNSHDDDHTDEHTKTTHSDNPRPCMD